MIERARNPTIPSEALRVFLNLKIHSISQVTQNKHSVDYIKQQNIMRKSMSWWEPQCSHSRAWLYVLEQNKEKNLERINELEDR